MNASNSKSQAATSMHIEVLSRDSSTHTELRGWAVSMIANSFQRFQGHIQKVVLRIRDVNGPKGGIDKEVVISMQMRGGGSQLIRQRGGSHEQAIVRGLRRCKQALAHSPLVGARRPRPSRRMRGLAGA